MCMIFLKNELFEHILAEKKGRHTDIVIRNWEAYNRSLRNDIGA